MRKIRIYELARELSIPSKKLVDALADLDLNVQSHMSTIDERVVILFVMCATSGR